MLGAECLAARAAQEGAHTAHRSLALACRWELASELSLASSPLDLASEPGLRGKVHEPRLASSRPLKRSGAGVRGKGVAAADARVLPREGVSTSVFANPMCAAAAEAAVLHAPPTEDIVEVGRLEHEHDWCKTEGGVRTAEGVTLALK